MGYNTSTLNPILKTMCTELLNNLSSFIWYQTRYERVMDDSAGAGNMSH